MQAIVDAVANGQIPAQVAAVISNRPYAKGLQRAADASIETAVIDHKQYADREECDRALIARIDQYQPDLIVLAGFMRILSDDFIDHFADRIINIHPSLLPKYKGLHPHQQALDAGDKEHGASVHFVNKELDSGAVVLQTRLAILADDDADSLAARTLQQEHIIYPLAIQWYAEGRLECRDDIVLFDNKILTRPIIWQDQHIQF